MSQDSLPTRPAQPPLLRIGGVLALLLSAALFCQGATGDLARARELVDAGDAAAAVALLDGLLKHQPLAEGYLLRSTAHFMLGDLAQGSEDLDQALETDPSLRQGWLNRAALSISEGRIDAALESFKKAQELDPGAPDNDVNIGVALLLKGELEKANGSFARYLEHHPDSADAFYLVATNYAMAGYAGLAIQQLQRAIAVDEKSRLRARTDRNFSDLTANSRFQEILSTDAYRLPPGAHFAAQDFDLPYAGSSGGLLSVVLEILQLNNQPFDPRVEVTPGWALIWADFRIKVSTTTAGKGRVELSAPAPHFTLTVWRRRTEELFRQIAVRAVGR
jgi:tetratricopeptide (TPR) repeat protein